MTPFLAEFIGTLVLIVFGGGVVASAILKDTKAENAGWLVITLGWGLAVTIAIYAVGSISGAHLNPAVTIALASVGDFNWVDVPMYILAQVLGAFVGACIVWLHFLPHWKLTTDQGTKLAVFATGPAVRNVWANVLSEISGTFFLIIGLMFIGSNKFTDGLNPLVVGGLIVAIGLSLGATTGYAINPARDLGPRLAHFILPIAGKGTSDWQYAWIPVVAPIIGGTLAAVTYKALFAQQVSMLLWVLIPIVVVVAVMAVITDKK
ncbi:MAG: MIP/aquaporin family protein [Bacteroidia bacterium]